MAVQQDQNVPCLKCGVDCSGFSLHKWRAKCLSCNCSFSQHDVTNFSKNSFISEMEFSDETMVALYESAQKVAKSNGLNWLPLGIDTHEIDAFITSLPTSEIPRGELNAKIRQGRIRRQIPPQDLKPAVSLNNAKSNLPTDSSSNHLDAEIREATKFQNTRNRRDFGLGRVDRVSEESETLCADCSEPLRFLDFCVRVRPEHHPSESAGNDKIPVWHPGCFKCANCSENLVDFAYAWQNGKPYCLRHYGQMIRPRCATCDHLIFSEEYTRAMDKEHHSGHFACNSCDASLSGQRYILRDDEPHCLACYESKFANSCHKCNKKIGSDSKDLSFKDRHWHEMCFICSSCSKSLSEKPFATKDDQLYCSDCYDERFAARCDGCQGVFKGGMRKYEYRDQQWHEDCFVCVECRQPIGTNSFIPRDETVVCVPCYEEKYAQRCSKCTQIIRRGGVTFRGDPWHKECFVCTGCGKQLAGLKFTSKSEQPYCADCYGELFANKCVRCSKPITGFGGCKFISFEERHWHSDCFTCSKCDCNLVGCGFLTKEEQIMCSACGR